jgi:DNA-binding IclR family transcriptional regulator
MQYVNTTENGDGFDRLQRLLVDLRDGESIRLTDAAQSSGLSADTCRAMLEGLTRVGLMSREGDERFVRRCADPAGS